MLRFPVVGLCVALTAAAQSRSPVTIEQAIQEAVEKNLDLIASRSEISVAETRLITARLRPNPVVTLTGEHLDVLGTGYSLANGAGPGEFSYRTDFVLERGGKRTERIAVAELDRSVAELSVANAVRSLIYDVQTAFVDVQLAKENLALTQQNLKALDSIVEVNTTRVRTGDLAQVELVRSQVAALQTRNTVRQAQLRLNQARNRLQLLMGRVPPASDFDVTGSIRRDAAVAPLDGFYEQALKFRPDLNGLIRSQARSASDLRSQIAQGKMDFTVGTEYRRQQGINGTGNSLGFFFSAPLPVFNRNQGEIERARREQQQIEARIRALQASIRTELESAYQQLTSSRSLLEEIEKNMMEKARDVRKTTEYSYRRGEASLVEFLDAQRAFNDTMQSYNESRADYARGLYLVDFVAGRTVNP